MTRVFSSSLALLALVAGPTLAAQATPDSAARIPAPSPAPVSAAPPATAAPLNFSGVIFGSYNVQPSTTPNQQPSQVDNQFILDRAYLTFRMPAGDRTSVRITTDVYQTTEATANAYTIRAKYAYLQYDAPKSPAGAQLLGRVGILHNVVIDHVESFWPRWLSATATERAGFFSSADVGIAGQYTMPARGGEIYASVVNGSGYTSRERDRFKDFALRVSLTPLATRVPSSSLLNTLTLTAWGYKGALASGFVNGGAGQVGPVGEALDRSRAGLFAGIRDPRLTLGGELAVRRDGVDQGANTALSPRTRGSVTGRVLSAFVVVRPLAFGTASGKSPVGVVARYDRVNPTTSAANVVPAPSSENGYHNLITGVTWDLSPKAQLALDYQESLAANNGVSSAPPVQSRGFFAHFVVTF